jgi:hypothetical protein
MILTKKGKLSAKYKQAIVHLNEINRNSVGEPQEITKVVCIERNNDVKGDEYELLHLYVCLNDKFSKEEEKYFIFNERWEKNDFGSWFTDKEFNECFRVVP